ncbi:MAG: pitrilysin family protein, partial [Clostridiales bacterium]
VYGLPTIGSKTTVGNMTPDDLRAYLQQHYIPANTVLAVAGNVHREDVLAAAEKYLPLKPLGKKEKLDILPQSQSGQVYTFKDIEQTHLCLGFPAFKESDEDFYAANVLNVALGGGISSRLFQEAREKRGFCYSVYSYLSTYLLDGYLAAYASTNPKKVNDLLKVIWEQMENIRAKGLREDEIHRAKQQLKCSLFMGVENSSNVMNRLGRMETTMGRILTVEEVADKVLAVSNQDILRVAERIFCQDKMVLSTVGPQEEKVDLAHL